MLKSFSRSVASDLIRGLLDLSLAPVCVGCRGPISPGAADRIICRRCWSGARPLPSPRCERCWTPLPTVGGGVDAACRECPGLRPAIRAIRSAYLLDDISRPLVHAVKYRGWHSASVSMAARMARVRWPLEVEEDSPHIVPVPLSRVRLRERGYNQAALLGMEIARLKGWRYAAEALERVRSAGSQTTLHPAERRANVAGAFRATGPGAETIGGQHAIVVDDVWTTGATALACVDALLSAGARAVSVLTFARALPELERSARRVELARR